MEANLPLALYKQVYIGELGCGCLIVQTHTGREVKKSCSKAVGPQAEQDF